MMPSMRWQWKLTRGRKISSCFVAQPLDNDVVVGFGEANPVVLRLRKWR
jgi:hypothetical protein